MQYIPACLLTKQNFFWCFDNGLEHMVARSRGYGTNFNWPRKACDISTCDWSPNGNLEKYGRPMKSAILLYEQVIHLTQLTLRPNTQLLRNWQHAYQSFLSHFLVLFPLQFCGILGEFVIRMLT